LSHDEILKVRVRNPSSGDWWFEGLIQQYPANDNALNAEIYALKCYEDKSGYIAFDRTSEKVYYWCTRQRAITRRSIVGSPINPALGELDHYTFFLTVIIKVEG
jgi:hypothetical protein